MPYESPALDELSEMSSRLGLKLDRADLEAYRRLIDRQGDSYRYLEEHGTAQLPPGHLRRRWWRPAPRDNPLGAWAVRAAVQGKGQGILSGRRVVLKDNISVANVPLSNGSAIFEGYMPAYDATVVTRILDAGGQIVGKATCEDMCYSGGSHTSKPAPVRNPHNQQFMAGGSSSGSAVLVSTGEADLALGGDQGGSIRIPSAWTGVCGLKPTWGLVPYTGVLAVEPTLDHVGPIGRTVADVALLLEAVAGRDPLDPRQGMAGCPYELPPYTRSLEDDPRHLRIGVLQQGFEWQGASEPDVDAVVQQAATRLAATVSSVEPVSIPEHREAHHLFNAISAEGAWAHLIQGNGTGYGYEGLYDTSLARHFSAAQGADTHKLPATAIVNLLTGAYLQQKYGGQFYGHAQNLRRALRKAYDEALREVDLLLMPTTPQKAQPLPGQDADLATYVNAGFSMVQNVVPFNITGNPAMSVPVGTSQGLPIAAMLVGRHFEEPTVLLGARTLEESLA